MLHMAFDKRVVINTAQMEWSPSPMSGVCRKRLAREEAERGHATSIVRYEPGARFSAHDHPLGEEILVLEGTFSDQNGNFTTGSYFRNPEGFRHAPFSEEGCIILVKLHQFQPSDTAHLCMNTLTNNWEKDKSDISILPLHQHGDEIVEMQQWPAGSLQAHHQHQGGEEIFVVNGLLEDEYGEYPAGTWIRNPPGSTHSPRAIETTKLWVKSGHLR